jgi:hypothetical protein
MICKTCLKFPPPTPRRCVRCGGCLIHSRPCACKVCARCGARRAPRSFCTCCSVTRGVAVCLPCHLPGTASGRRIAAFPHRKCDLKDPARSAPTYELCRLRRALGVELELGSWGVHGRSNATYSGFLRQIPTFAGEFVRDGSVTPSGMELVSRKLEGDDIFTALGELCKGLHGSGASANRSCGMHVHVDAVDLSMYDLRRIALAWELLCPKLWGTLVSAERSTNSYCTTNDLTLGERRALCAAGTAVEITDWFYHHLYGMSKDAYESREAWKAAIARKREHKYENAARRKSLNFHSWMMRGTLEFRLKEGTTDPGDLLWWPQWCGWLVDWLSRQDDRTIEGWRTCGVPSLPDLTRSFHLSCAATGLVKWVEEKCAAAKQPKPSRKANPDEIAF